MSVHPTAVVAKEAKIHPSVKIGPYAIIGSHVEIGENTEVGAHAIISGHTTIGNDNVIHPSAVIGTPPQDLKFEGEKTYVKIGNSNHFREFVTVHLAEGEGNSTIIGDNNLFMAYVHIAHNCIVGNNNILSNCATLAGHVEVGNRAVFGGFSGIHQFCKIGDMAMIGGMSKIVKDVPPFIRIDGNPARVIGLNSVGLRRNMVSKESINNLRQLYKVFFTSELNVSQVLEKWSTLVDADDKFVTIFKNFVSNAKRGVYKRTRSSNITTSAVD